MKFQFEKMEEFKGSNAISHHLLERISNKGDSPLRRFRRVRIHCSILTEETAG